VGQFDFQTDPLPEFHRVHRDLTQECAMLE
jgi:hypothetical protein